MVDPDTRQIVGPGQEGEFWIKGPQVMKGYHNNEAATREMVTEDGWLQTGEHTGISHLGLKCVRLAQNGTNLRLLKIIFSTFWQKNKTKNKPN